MEREAAMKKWHEGMGECVAWLSPPTAIRAIPLEDVTASMNTDSFRHIANFLGLCAISVPTGPMEGTIDDVGALPTSLQITRKGGDEAMALRIAKAYESARGPLAHPPHSAPRATTCAVLFDHIFPNVGKSVFSKHISLEK